MTPVQEKWSVRAEHVWMDSVRACLLSVFTHPSHGEPALPTLVGTPLACECGAASRDEAHLVAHLPRRARVYKAPGQRAWPRYRCCHYQQHIGASM